MIAYKVTHNRKSLFITDNEYRLNYEKGTVVTARKDTLGIFCFVNKEDALKMAASRNDSEILTVKGTYGKRLKFRPTLYSDKYLKYLKQHFSKLMRQKPGSFTRQIKRIKVTNCPWVGDLAIENCNDSTIVFKSVIVID